MNLMISNRFVARLFSLVLVMTLLGAQLLLVAPTSVSAAATTYYVDSDGGNDGNSGTSAASPWKTLAKVNSMTFGAGDKVLFKSGSSWTGTLQPNGSGSSGSPIIFDKYGSGSNPVLNGAGAASTVYLYNVQYITVQNLEITNDAATVAKRSGILVVGKGSGLLNSIHLRNLNIHNVKGSSNRDTDMYLNAAIYVMTQDGPTGSPLASFNDLVVENNNIHDNTTMGFYSNGTGTHWNDVTTFQSWYTNVQIKNNTIARTGADCIVVGYGNGVLIEHNACYDIGVNGTNHRWIAGIWTWATKDATIQYNEVARVHFQSGTDNDSTAFDSDIHTYGTHTYQYNYSHDNSGGFFMSMGDLRRFGGQNIVRYNISKNDNHLHWADATFSSADQEATHVYNNTFIQNSGNGFKIQGLKSVSWEGSYYNTKFENNIFSISGGGPIDFPSTHIYDSNLYDGFTPPTDANGVIGTPQFVNSSSGGDGRATTSGYRLQATSPAIDAGKVIANNGGQDFWGGPVGSSPDIGANEYNASYTDTQNPTTPVNVTVSSVTDVSVKLTWNSSVDNFGVMGYNVYKDYNAITLTPASANSVSIVGLQPNTTYVFYVKAVDAAWNYSSGGSALTVTTKSAPPAVSAIHTAAPVTIDGNLTETDWQITTPITKTVSGATYTSSQFGVMWDSTYLYVGVNIADPALFNDSTNIYDDDSFDIYIDANHNRNFTYDAYDRQFAFGYNDLTGSEKAGHLTGVLFKTTPITGGYSLEAAIPWSNLGITPTAGMKFGFDIANNDDSNGGARDSQTMWNGTGNNWTNTAAFGDVLLLP
ncbi:sugar-binding protein [Paenibacillus qinlingensis]|uniref:sugar-binding protein n=1 Tax=Paenibacillus qinlingensis TaxID=1837343 RepID=UPI001565BC97|nr:sugar-binding protein [Paenibacillus qinlingensis]NQX58665.1 right-handed parallel beta-helix repeat-containing protein [Paenibacillus qinlingensis]